MLCYSNVTDNNTSSFTKFVQEETCQRIPKWIFFAWNMCNLKNPVSLTRTGCRRTKPTRTRTRTRTWLTRTRRKTSLTKKDLQLNLQLQSSNDNEHAQQTTVIQDYTDKTRPNSMSLSSKCGYCTSVSLKSNSRMTVVELEKLLSSLHANN